MDQIFIDSVFFVGGMLVIWNALSVCFLSLARWYTKRGGSAAFKGTAWHHYTECSINEGFLPKLLGLFSGVILILISRHLSSPLF